MVKTPERKAVDVESSPEPAVGCCLPFWRRAARKNKKSVKFMLAANSSEQSIRRRRSKRSATSPTSRKSFYSAMSRLSSSPLEDEEDRLLSTTTEGPLSDRGDEMRVCPCGFPAHSQTFDPLTPLMIPPLVEPGSFAELTIIAKAIQGRWIAVTERSDSLDAQMAYVGIGKMKRMIMNKLVIPLGAQIVDDGQTLKVWIETPTGNKTTHASLVGKETFDADADLGDWSAESYMTDYSWAKFCSGKDFRALQMKRLNPKLGTAFETKAVLPDAEFGRILLYNITIHPPAGKGDIITVDRVYKWVSELP